MNQNRNSNLKWIIPLVVGVVLTITLCITTFVGITKITKAVFGKKETAENTKIEETVAKNDVTEEEKETTVSLSKNSHEVEKTDTNVTVNCLDVSDVVESVMPSVVAITDNLEVTTGTYYNPYSYFFGGGTQEPSSRESAASGSGVIVAQNDKELLIVTNSHVVDNEGNFTTYTVSSTGLSVCFMDGQSVSAVVKGTDPQMDLAVVAVSLDDISKETREAIRIAVVGSSDDIKVGNGVIAIGNALGYGQSVTAGIVSAKDRAVTMNKNTRYLLQVDAAINPGNSGGGLFNTSGELIGINCAKYESTDVEGMGFAIPISSAESIIEDLMNKEEIPEDEKGYLGINGETVPSTYVEKYGYPIGVSITRIVEGSPAEEAGLQIYDIVTAINDREVTTMDGLKNIVNSYPAGTEISLTVKRPEGRGFTEKIVKVTLSRYSDINFTNDEE